MGNGSSSAANNANNAVKANHGPALSLGDVQARKSERVQRDKNLAAVHNQIKTNVQPAWALHEKPPAKPFHEELKKKRKPI